MKTYEKLLKVNEELTKLEQEKEQKKNQYYEKAISYDDYFVAYLTKYEQKKKELIIKTNILKNNLYLEIHNSLLKVYKTIYKKYEDKNIGEKRKQEIEQAFKKQIEELIDYNNESIPYYNKLHLFFNSETKYKEQKEYKVFNIRIEKLKYDYSYYVEDEVIKDYYNYELPNYIENVEEETKRLIEKYNEIEIKKAEIEKQLEKLKKEISNNFKRNLYNDDISKLNRALTLYW